MDISNRTIFPRPKTDSSEDIVPLPKFINTMLTERHQHEKELNKYFDERSYFIFGGMTPNTTVMFKRNSKKLSPIITF